MNVSRVKRRCIEMQKQIVSGAENVTNNKNQSNNLTTVAGIEQSSVQRAAARKSSATNANISQQQITKEQKERQTNSSTNNKTGSKRRRRDADWVENGSDCVNSRQMANHTVYVEEYSVPDKVSSRYFTTDKLLHHCSSFSAPSAYKQRSSRAHLHIHYPHQRHLLLQFLFVLICTVTAIDSGKSILSIQILYSF